MAPIKGAPPTISGSPSLAALATPQTFDFVIPAAGGRVSIAGMYRLDFPANAVCDPTAQDSQDGYAAAAWDSPCTVATTDITVHATLKESNHRLWADFSPSLRFAPNAVVTMSSDLLAPIVRFYADANNGDGSAGASRQWGILFAPAIDAQPVDDSKTDASVRTKVDFSTGRISRRIKHFTGYNLITGVWGCIVQPSDPFCVEMGDGGH